MDLGPGVGEGGGCFLLVMLEVNTDTETRETVTGRQIQEKGDRYRKKERHGYKEKGTERKRQGDRETETKRQRHRNTVTRIQRLHGKQRDTDWKTEKRGERQED